MAASTVTSSSATINWTTDEASTSQVSYGTTSLYGSTTILDPTLVTSHSVLLSGLTPSTTYHFQVRAQDARGNVNSSGDYTFTTALAGLRTLLEVRGDSSEVSGVTNGSAVTPSTGPAGFAGSVLVHGGGSVNFTAAQGGDGVYFLQCCKNTNNAYFRFTGSTVGDIFNVNQGQISLDVQSRYSFAQRETSASSQRYAFDVRDGNGNHLFSFMWEVVSSSLVFHFMVDGKDQYYFVPKGTEDVLFGSGVILSVTITWSAGTAKLYLNNRLANSSSFSVPNPNWSSASNFDFGAYEHLSFGGFSVSDDAIADFVVEGP